MNSQANKQINILYICIYLFIYTNKIAAKNKMKSNKKLKEY